MFRRSLELFSRRRKLRRKLPEKLGGNTIVVSPDAALRFWKRDLSAADRMLFRFAEEYIDPGTVLWDIGANVGLLTFAAAHLAGPSGCVVAVEADTFLVDLLRQSVALQRPGGAPVKVLPAAVSGRMTVVDFNIAERGRAGNYLASCPGASQTGGTRERVQVISITLDWLLGHIPAPTVVKIDVETAETLVLRGAKRLLQTVRPVMLCEVANSSVDEVTAMFKNADYDLYDYDYAEVPAVGRATRSTLARPR